MQDLAKSNVVVVGMAKSGLAAVELLLEKGARVTATDEKPLAELPQAAALLESRGVPFVLQGEDPFEDCDLIVLSPGVPADLDSLGRARARGISVVGELELAGWFLRGRSIGITGANGKTTTTALAGHILTQCGVSCQVGGNIGTPPASMVRSSRDGEWNVLELSSFQLETIETFRAAIGACLNVTPDHLDRHHTFENYANAKARLFETQTGEDFAVLNAGDPTCAGFRGRTAATPFWFSSTGEVERGLWLDGDHIFFEGRILLEVADVPLRGRHNLENVMAAAACAILAGVPPERISAAVATFPGVEHRLEFVRRRREVDYYNDSKATNVDAVLKAIDAFSGGLWIILGGKDKGSDYAPLRAPLKAKARAVLLVGAARAKIAAHLAGLGAPLLDCETLDGAIAAAAREAAPGDTVLLAPACASFDQFENFEHRGRVFKSLVAALGD